MPDRDIVVHLVVPWKETDDEPAGVARFLRKISERRWPGVPRVGDLVALDSGADPRRFARVAEVAWQNDGSLKIDAEPLVGKTKDFLENLIADGYEKYGTWP